MVALEIGLLVAIVLSQGVLLGFILIQGRAFRHLIEELALLIGGKIASFEEKLGFGDDQEQPAQFEDAIQGALASWLGSLLNPTPIDRDGAGRFVQAEIIEPHGDLE